MNSQDSLRFSILVALGVQGCAGSPQPSTSSTSPTKTDDSAVINIPPVASATSTPDPVDSSESGIPAISSKTGWIEESNGSVHRAAVSTCDATIDLPACAGDEDHFSCRTDADCTAHPHGKCASGKGQMGDYCTCYYSCASDSDCGADEACVCKGVGRNEDAYSQCVPARCRVDADCESKQCGLSVFHNGCFSKVSLACRTKSDSCKSDLDCKSSGYQCAVVRPGPNPTWQCAKASCVIGRPLVIDGQVHAAEATNRDDWQARLPLVVDNLNTEDRAIAANHYAAMAAMEHASVASFARFSLQLLALAAPAELLRDAHQAALDEIEHARTSYALANLFGKTNLGPDKLPGAVAPLSVNVESFVRALVFEGCVGETLGAAEGKEAARVAVWPELSEPLAKIADDEERHAILAWRSLQWALDTFGAAAHDSAAEALADAMAFYSENPVVAQEFESVGVLSARSLGALRRDVISTVVVPCAQALGISVQANVTA